MTKTLKKSLAIILTVLTIFSLSICSFAAITIDEAKAIAFKDAGVTEAQAVLKECKVDGKEFDIEFFVGKAEYDYSIKNDGTIVSFAWDSNNLVQGTNTIDAAAAKEKALAFIGVSASDAKAITTEYDADFHDGADYEVTFIVDSKEYSVCVSAVDGSILEYEYEVIAGGNNFFASIIAFFESIIAFFRNLFVK